MVKTVAMKVLDGRGIAYEVSAYPQEMREAMAIAALLAIPASQLFKTLVVTRRSARPMLVMIPADRQLDLKKLSRAVGAKMLQICSQSPRQTWSMRAERPEPMKRTRMSRAVSPLIEPALRSGIGQCLDRLKS